MASSADDNDDDLEFREDQRKALEELDRLQKTSPDDWTDERDQEFYQILTTEPPPDYNEVRSRLDKLNEELTNDPTPVESNRERRVMFPEDPVQSVAPDPDEVEEHADDTDAGEEDYDEQSPTINGNHQEDNTDNSDGTSGKVLVVRNGKYMYVAKNDVEAEQGDLFDDSSDEEEVTRNRSQRPHSSATPGRRPQSGSSSNGELRYPVKPSRPPSAPASSRFTYRLPPDHMKKVEEKRRKDEEREKRREEERQHEEERRKKDNEEAFQAWLRRKEESQNKEHQQRKDKEKEEDEKRKDEEEEMRRKRPTYEDWEKQKKRQSKSERKLLRREFEELQSNSSQRSPEECRRAFKQWLKKKEEQKKEEARLERYRARITRLALRRSRKSQALANALAAANSYRYMEYYGYR